MTLKDKLKNVSKRGIIYLPLFLFVFFFFFYFITEDVYACKSDAECKSPEVCDMSDTSMSGGYGICLPPSVIEKNKKEESSTLGDTIQNKVILGFAWIVYSIGGTVGYLLTFITQQLIIVAQWNHFIDIPVVVTGWVILRDLCNMFFVLLLLVVAFATILRIDGYDIKKMVPKILIMAVLINFSKTICGLIIDASQIIMLTFVSGFADMGAAKFTDLMGLSEMYKMTKASEALGSNLGMQTLMGFLGALIASLIMLVVIVVALAVFVVRVVYLWVYIIMSPLAFFASSFQQGKSYSGRWVSEFVQQVTAGPILAFFMWIALSIAGTSDKSSIAMMLGKDLPASATSISNFFTNGPFATYMITIALLVAGLMESKKVGGAAGAIAGKGLDYINKGKGLATGASMGVAAWGGKKTWDATKNGMKGTGRIGLGVAGGLDRVLGKWTGNKTLASSGFVAGSIGAAINAPGQMVAGLKRRAFGDTKANKALHDARVNGTDLDWDGFDDWKKEVVSGKETGRYTRVDKAGATQIAQDSNGKDLKAMGALKASFFESSNIHNGAARAAANKAQDEEISKHQKTFEDSGMSSGQMLQRMNDNSVSQSEKMALALTLAVQKGFSNKDDVANARKVFGSNHILADKFNDNVDKNQADLGYNFKDSSDVERFKGRIDSGKIDSTKLSAGAYKNADILGALQEHHGKDFKRVAETAYKRGNKYQTAVDSGLQDLRDNSTNPDDWEKNANLHASLTGSVNSSFTNKKTNTKEYGSIGKYFQNKKAGDLNKISAKEMQALADDTDVNGYGAIVDNISYSKLKDMKKQGDNPELVKKLITIIKNDPMAKAHNELRGDTELSNY